MNYSQINTLGLEFKEKRLKLSVLGFLIHTQTRLDKQLASMPTNCVNKFLKYKLSEV